MFFMSFLLSTPSATLSTIPSKNASLKLSKNLNIVESTFVKLRSCWIDETGFGL